MSAPLRYRISRADEVPVGDDWLTPREREQLARFRVRKRVADWRLGRYAAKAAVASALDEPKLDPRAVEIRGARGGAPSAWSGAMRLPVEISLSHTARRALCVVAPLGRAVGCDLERVGSRARSATAAESFLGARERAWIDALADAASRTAWVALAWSAREAALKALGGADPTGPRTLEVLAPVSPRLPSAAWERFELREAGGAPSLRGWWRSDDGWALTIVSAVALDPPVGLP